MADANSYRYIYTVDLPVIMELTKYKDINHEKHNC
mgnify:CR=1 FL=1